MCGTTVKVCECQIINFRNTDKADSHWMMYFKNKMHTIAYFRFGEPAPQNLFDYFGDEESERKISNISQSDIQI